MKPEMDTILEIQYLNGDILELVADKYDLNRFEHTVWGLDGVEWIEIDGTYVNLKAVRRVKKYPVNK